MSVYFLTIVVATGLAWMARPQGVTTLRPEMAADDIGPRRARLTGAAFATLLLLVCVAGLRWRVGVDFAQYAYNYQHRYLATPISAVKVWDEPGIRLVALVAHRLHDDASTMFLLASLVTVGLTVRTLYRNSRAFALSILLYILSAAWQGSFNAVRQYLACAIVFAGHELILSRRFRAYTAVVALAFLFHVSAIVLILLYWVPRQRIRTGAVVALVAAALLTINAYPYLADFIDSIRGAGYTDTDYFAREVSAFRIALAAGPALIYLFLTDTRSLSERGFFYGNMMIIHATVFIASSGSAYIARLGSYTLVWVALALPDLINMPSRASRSLVAFVALVAFGASWFIETSSTPVLANFQWAFGAGRNT